MFIKNVLRGKKKQTEDFIDDLLSEIKKAKIKGDSELKIFADQLPSFLTGRYDLRARDKKRTKKRVEIVWQEIQEELFCHDVQFTTSSAGTTALIVKF